jgi:integrase
MSVLIECKICKKRQSVKNKRCRCGEDLDKAKRSRKTKFYIRYRLPGGKQRQEMVGFSIKEARDADSKRKVQKRENKIFDILPDSKLTFQELSEWYLNLQSVKNLVTWDRRELALRNFNKVFGDMITGNIKPIDLENYQEKREGDGLASGTIDMEINIAKTMVLKGFDNDLVGGRVLKAFKRVKNKLKPGSNARKRIISFEEYIKLINESKSHFRDIVIVAFNTGMRTAELRDLKWSYIDRKEMMIRLPAEVTKEKRPKIIPINHYVKRVLDSAPRALMHDFVFTYRGKHILHKQGFKLILKRTCEKARIPYGQKTHNGIIFHDIRRTVKTNMLAAGADKVYRDLILGHSLKGMDLHYLSPSEDSLKGAMDKYTRWLDEQIGNISAVFNQNLAPNQ